jgi:competence protein ComEC
MNHYFGLSFLFGTLAGQFLPQLLPVIIYTSLLMIALCLLFYIKFCPKKYKVIFVCLFLFLFSFIYQGFMAHYRIHNTPVIPTSTQTKIEGCVVSIITKDERKESFIFKSYSHAGQKSIAKMRLSDYGFNDYQSGECYELAVKIKKPHGFYNPGGFDYEAYLFSENIKFTGYVKNKIKTIKHKKDYFHYLRAKIYNKIKKHTKNLQFQNIIIALVLGQRGNISSENRNVFINTGTAHLIAISGLHIGLVAGFGFFIGIIFWLILPLHNVISKQIFALSIAIILAFLYAVLAGLSLPTMRAILMLLVFAGSIFLRRHSTAINTLSVALILVLLLDPFAPMQVGFWLSFLAVAFILYIHPKIAQLKKVYQFLIFVPSISTALIIPTFFFFGSSTLLSAPANIIAVPIISFLVLPFSLLASVFSFILPQVALWLFLITDLFLQFLFWYLQKISEMSFAKIFIDKNTTLMLLSIVLFIFFFIKKQYKQASSTAILFLTLIFFRYDNKNIYDIKMTVLDVGQGLSVVIKTANKTLIFDTGEKFSKKFNIVDSVLLPFLQESRTRKLDTLVISHSDSDHSSNIKSLLARYPTNTIYTGDINKIKNSSQCHKGIKWRWDNIDFRFLSPNLHQKHKKDNNNSCVLKISSSKYSILITSDIEKEIEKKLIKDNIDLQTDILLVPHHGSKTSSTVEFLQKTKPRYAIVSAGYKNKFHHPSIKILKRYQDFNIPILNTAYQGAIMASIKDEIKITTHRQNTPRFWHSY